VKWEVLKTIKKQEYKKNYENVASHLFQRNAVWEQAEDGKEIKLKNVMHVTSVIYLLVDLVEQ